MPFDHIIGQPTAIETLKRSLLAGQVHHALRFEGPDGVGKELTAMALAQALVCEGGDPLGCGHCSACSRAVTMGEGDPPVPIHPDVIFIERGLYPPQTLGRSTPENKEISVDQIRRLVLPRAPFPPHDGRAQVFIVREADKLSVSAANALLKTLEEPGDKTYFILLTSQPSRLLPTIHSRTLRVRFSPLSDELLLDLLVAAGIEEPLAREVVPLAEGSVSLGMELADDEISTKRKEFVTATLTAVHAQDARPSLKLAELAATSKNTLHANLQAVAATVARETRQVPNVARARLLAQQYDVIVQAMTHLESNAAPALTIENMMLRLRALTG